MSTSREFALRTSVAESDAYKMLRLSTALGSTLGFSASDILNDEEWRVAAAVGAGPLILGAAFSGALAALRDDSISIGGVLTAEVLVTDQATLYDLTIAKDWLASGLAFGGDRMIEQGIVENSLYVFGVEHDAQRLRDLLTAIALTSAHICDLGR